jgi:hypothetical protein
MNDFLTGKIVAIHDNYYVKYMINGKKNGTKLLLSHVSGLVYSYNRIRKRSGIPCHLATRALMVKISAEC